MTTRIVLTCDNCSRQQEVTTGAEDVAGAWGELRVGKARPRDICPTCIAELGGWGKNVPAPGPSSRTYTFDMAPRGSHVRA